MKINFHSIGWITSPFKNPVGMPIQSSSAKGARGKVVLLPEYVDGLKDLDGFSHIILLYHFHKADGHKLTVTPFLDDQPRGVFASRAPQRPNRIGLSVVKLIQVEGAVLSVENIDILDGTPLLDIKPYVPLFDQHDSTSVGWLEKAASDFGEVKSDNRFAND